MDIGCPIVFSEGTEKRRFIPLASISQRRDDTNSFNESLLQELIDATPNVLPIREYLPSTTTLFSLGREVPVDLGAKQGFIDNLLVTNDGYLVIVETKLYRNPEGIREVIAQTLQYGMAIGQRSLVQLEEQIRSGQSPALRRGETICESVARLASDTNQSALVADDFEESLERHLKCGEILLLIVSDGIHVAVERVTEWLNKEGNTNPFKFGLVELKFYTCGNDKLVVPRTTMKTREISRHVVVVNIRPTMDVDATARVTDDFRNAAGGKMQESRTVKASAPPLTKNLLLQLAATEDQKSVAALFDALEVYPLDFRGIATTLQVGFTFPPDSDDFHPLGHLYKGGVWAYPLSTIRKVLGSDAMIAFHREANQFGRFYRDDQIENPESTGGQVKYSQLRDKANEFAAFLNAYRSKAIELLEAESVG